MFLHMPSDTWRRAAVIFLAGALPFAACSNGPLAITCEEFLGLSSSEQQEIIVEWTKQDSPFEDSTLRDLEASQNLPLMIEHCQNNLEHRLEDLESTFGFG